MSNFYQFRPIEHGELLIVGGDCSAGGGDYSVAQFYSRTKTDFPMVYRTKQLASVMTQELYPVLNLINERTGVRPIVGYERNFGGVFELERLATLNRENKFEIFKMPSYGSQNSDQVQPKKLGWDTNSATRPEMLSNLKEFVDNHLGGIYDKETINELFSFIVVQTSSSWKAQAEQHAHDDHVMSMAIALKMAEFIPDSYGASEREPQLVGYQDGFGGVRIPVYK